MTDIVERLREDARGGKAYHELSDEAADMIELLRRLVDEREADLGRMHGETGAEIERLNDCLTDYHRVKELGRADAADNRALRSDNARLRQSLHEIDAIAIRKEAGAVVKMQKVARAALMKDTTP